MKLNRCLIFLPFLIIFLSYLGYSKKYKFDASEILKFDKENSNILSNDINLKFQIKKDKADRIFSLNDGFLEIGSFPLSNNQIGDIELSPITVAFDENTEWYAGTKEGLARISPPSLFSFKGKIINQPNSYVFLNYADGMLFAYIRNEAGYIYSISPFKDGSKNNDHLLSPHFTSENDNRFVCLTDNSQITTNEAEDIINDKRDETLGNHMLELKVACEGTYDFYALMGSNLQIASAYIASVLTQVSKIYQDNLNVNLVISYVLIWQEASRDPYIQTENLYEKLSIMPNLWINKSIDRAITCLFADVSNQPANTTVAGIAFSGSPNFGTLCNKSLGYSVFGVRGNGKYPTMNYTWDVNCAAHEIGHNFSSPHTHNCDYFVPPIDTCVTLTDPGGVNDACIKSGKAKPVFGTLMSYCHLTHPTRSVDLNFHPRCITIMRKAAENAKCAYESPNPRIYLVEPLGDKIYKSNTEIKIRWRTTKVTNVNIKYSLDSGLTWITLRNKQNAADREIIWKLPNITAWNVLVLIENSDNPQIFDRSLKTFSIVAPAIILDNPNAGDKYGFRESVNLSWTTFFVDNVRIEFSSDAGKSWSIVTNNVSGFTYKWIIPSVVSNQCKIRLISLPDESVITESPLFSIGKQKARLIKPNGGEVLCASSSFDIEWESDFVNTLFLEYSTNNGESWLRVTLGSFKPQTTKYNWAVPFRPSKQALLRIYTKPDSVIYLDTTDNVFTIDSCLTDINETTNSSPKFDDLEIFFNNSNKTLQMKYLLNNEFNNFSIEMFDILGNKVASLLHLTNYNSNIINKEIKLPELSQGNYFLVFRINREFKVFAIQIIN